jgi:hypothetical protein
MAPRLHPHPRRLSYSSEGVLKTPWIGQWSPVAQGIWIVPSQ